MGIQNRNNSIKSKQSAAAATTNNSKKMKLFNFFTVGALASEVTLSRTRRDVAYSFSGEEAADFYSDILADISGDTVDEIDQMIMNLMGESDESFRAMGELGMRKFRQLKNCRPLAPARTEIRTILLLRLLLPSRRFPRHRTGRLRQAPGQHRSILQGLQAVLPMPERRVRRYLQGLRWRGVRLPIRSPHQRRWHQGCPVHQQNWLLPTKHLRM